MKQQANTGMLDTKILENMGTIQTETRRSGNIVPRVSFYVKNVSHHAPLFDGWRSRSKKS